MKPAPPGVASPCINVCQMHAASGWCVGCLRTLDEIAAWGGMSDAGKRLVLQGLVPRRLARRAQQRLAATGPDLPPVAGGPSEGAA
jgi:predicted Fe-S protein YdhL (DUF1289 family)